jgi:hypothetical protein
MDASERALLIAHIQRPSLVRIRKRTALCVIKNGGIAYNVGLYSLRFGWVNGKSNASPPPHTPDEKADRPSSLALNFDVIPPTTLQVLLGHVLDVRLEVSNVLREGNGVCTINYELEEEAVCNLYGAAGDHAPLRVWSIVLLGGPCGVRFGG